MSHKLSRRQALKVIGLSPIAASLLLTSSAEFEVGSGANRKLLA